MNKKIILFLTAFLVIQNLSIRLFSQNELNHEILIRNIQNIDQIYIQNCIQKYDLAIQNNPTNEEILIQKCKFLEKVQYDTQNEINPNQSLFDSCYYSLIHKFPDNPSVLLYQIEIEYGDFKDSVLKKAEQLILDNPEQWTDNQKEIVYYEQSLSLYNQELYDEALTFMDKAIVYNAIYKNSIYYYEMLVYSGREKDAIVQFKSDQFKDDDVYTLQSKANLLFDLKEYSLALDLYKKILTMDSTLLTLSDLAKSFEKVGEIDMARVYLVSDTAISWDKNGALLNLLIHDLKYGSGKQAIVTYNQFRDIGFKVDPLGLYRVRVLLKNPFLLFKWRDVISIIIFLLIVGLLFLVPSFWILPIYFIGNYWNFKNKPKTSPTFWGLKNFWWISFGYLFANFCSFLMAPDIIYSKFRSWEFSVQSDALPQVNMVFVIIFALFAFSLAFNKKWNIYYTQKWSLLKVIGISIGTFFIVKIISAIYVLIMSKSLDIEIDQISNLFSPLLSMKESITDLFTAYGKWIPFLLIGIIGPIYEEIVFRGVIQDATQSYLNFWSANVVQSLLFAIIHYNLILFPFYFTFGMITGVFRKQSGGLLAGIIFHIINNSVALLVLMHQLAI
ncbi:MAG: hypothetical protein H6Q25_1064 [Bacteroidetes bacterium]|nr:hypothetical protein [Bacteroidota bacterium]